MIGGVVEGARSDDDDGDVWREWEMLRDTDHYAQDIVQTDDYGVASHAAHRISEVVGHELEWLPHGGSIYATWADLADLFAVGPIPEAEALALIQGAAGGWLQRSQQPDEQYLMKWMSETGLAVRQAWHRNQGSHSGTT